MIPEEFMTDRVIYKINLYTRLSDQNRFWYPLMSVIAIICPPQCRLIYLGVAAFTLLFRPWQGIRLSAE
jgi:hypothetical protein